MGTVIEESVAYMSIRMLMWLGAALAQMLLLSKWGSSATKNPLMLGYLIAGATGLAGIRDVWLLIFATTRTYAAAYIETFLDSAAFAAFMLVGLQGILLLISGGYCIVVYNLRELPRYIFVIPTLMVAAGTADQWLFLILQGSDALDNPRTERQQDELFGLLVSALVQSMLLVVAVVYILDNTENVAKQLEALAPGAQEAALADGALEDDDALQDVMAQDAQASQATAAPDLSGYNAVQEQITTVGEEVQRMQSAKLLRRFKHSVTAFIFIDILVLFLPSFLPLFMPPSWVESGSTADNVCRAGWNLVKLGFLLALAWVFRPVEEGNAYLQLGTYEGERPALETQIEMGGIPGMGATPGSPDLSPSQRGKQQAHQDAAPVNGQAKAAKRVTVVSPRSNGASGRLPDPHPEARFTLDDEEKID